MFQKLRGVWACLFLVSGGLHAAAVFSGVGDPGSTPGEFDHSTLTINSNSAMVNGSFDIRDLFGGNFGIGQSIFFDDDGTSHVYEVEFTLNNPIDLAGYELYLGNDGNDIDRAASRFQLLMGSTILSDVTISPNYNGAYGSHIIRITDTFTPVSGTTFTARFYGGASTYNGVRVMELDAILTPEPSALALSGLGGLCLWVVYRRRNRTASRA